MINTGSFTPKNQEILSKVWGPLLSVPSYSAPFVANYLPFGGYLPVAVESSTQDEEFTGKQLDDQFGLNWHYFGARYYRSRLGLWNEVDPLHLSYPGTSPFAYVENNPNGYVDRFGLWKDPIAAPKYRGYYSYEVNGATEHLWAPGKSKFGPVRNGGKQPHQGVDLAAEIGTEVVAVETGEVVYAGDTGGDEGKRVIIKFITKEKKTRYAVYSHLSEISVSEGKIKEGDPIGKTGKSGNASTGLTEKEMHLHFEIRTKQKAGGGVKE